MSEHNSDIRICALFYGICHKCSEFCWTWVYKIVFASCFKGIHRFCNNVIHVVNFWKNFGISIVYRKRIININITNNRFAQCHRIVMVMIFFRNYFIEFKTVFRMFNLICAFTVRSRIENSCVTVAEVFNTVRMSTCYKFNIFYV